MPQITFNIKTYGCQNCNWHTDNDKMEGGFCPSCNYFPIAQEVDLNRMMTVTIVGEEDIDTEITKMEEKQSMTAKQKDDHKAKRLGDIQKAIVKHEKLMYK